MRRYERSDQGRSRDGFSTKVHLLCDAQGNPVRFILTSGQQADVTQVEPLLADQQSTGVLADKGDDSNAHRLHRRP